ncbi:MAG: hypothetical protein JNJ46_07800 [Myxococcales bacterium]|nr:hypothetical protein [Myxococcales bacterium]
MSERQPELFHRPNPQGVLRWARRALISAVAIERFASGLLSSLLVFQLSERWGLSESRAAAWVGYFLAASYMTPLLGGLLCDRGLSARGACVLGCLGIALGYAALMGDRPLALLVGSGCLLCGAGLFRPGVQLLLDRLCDAERVAASDRGSAEEPTGEPASQSTRPATPRDEAYTWMHALINVGGMLAPLASEGLQRASGWAAVSTLAVGCMVAAIALIRWGVPQLAERDETAPLPRLEHPAVAVGESSSEIMPLPVAAGDSSDALRLPGPLLSFCVALMGFWMVYAQCSSTLLLWVRDSLDRRLQSWELPVSVFAGLPWALVVVLTPPVLALFRALRRQKREPNTLRKLSLGFVAVALGFAALSLAALVSASGWLGGTRAHMAWLLLALVAITVGELCVAPLGPVLLLKVAPLRLRGLVMALWFGTLGFGFIAGGAFAELWGTLSPPWFFALACGFTLLCRAQLHRGFYHSGNLDTLPARLCHG